MKGRMRGGGWSGEKNVTIKPGFLLLNALKFKYHLRISYLPLGDPLSRYIAPLYARYVMWDHNGPLYRRYMI